MQPTNIQDVADHDHTKDEKAAHHYRTMLIQRIVAALVAVAIGVLFLALPDSLTIGPNWLLLVVEAVLLSASALFWVYKTFAFT